MAIITVLNRDNLLLATDTPVIPAGDVDMLEDVIEASEKMQSLLEKQQILVKNQKEEGYCKGYEQGQKSAQKKKQDELVNEILKLESKYQQNRQQLAGEAITLAIQIVKRIASELGSERVVGELARTACDEFINRPNSRRITINVHSKNIDMLKKRFSSFASEQKPVNVEQRSRVISIKEDESLSVFDCIIETESGSTYAGLDHQLEKLEKFLNDKLITR